MGLDGVELIMAVEEEFAISISDAEAASCETPGGLIQLIVAKLDWMQKRVCPSLRGFHVVRSVLMEKAGAVRAGVKLNTPLRTLALPSRDLEIVEGIEAAMGVRSRQILGRPTWMSRLVWGVPLAVLLAGSIYISFFAALGIGFVVLLVAGLVTIPYARYFPAGARVRDLVPYAKTSAKIPTRQDIAKTVREIVIEQLGIRPEQYREEAHFVYDLGLD